jgi:Nuclease A inhibitor-like protein
MNPEKSNETNNSNNELILNALKEASKDLLFMSESEHPFEEFIWQAEDKEQKEITAELILQKTNHSPNTPLQFTDIDSFFAIATTEQDWHSSEDKETVKKYQNLVKIIKNNLTDVKVARTGEVEIDVYIIGKTPNQDFAGLSTKVIET